MNKIDFIKIIKMLSIAYNKDFDEDSIKLWYLNLKNYKLDIFSNVVNNIIREKKFMPSIAEVLEECEKYKTTMKYEIIEEMQKDGYFKDGLEYDKAIKFIEKGIIPSWFREDMKKYYHLKIENNKKLLSC